MIKNNASGPLKIEGMTTYDEGDMSRRVMINVVIISATIAIHIT